MAWQQVSLMLIKVSAVLIAVIQTDMVKWDKCALAISHLMKAYDSIKEVNRLICSKLFGKTSLIVQIVHSLNSSPISTASYTMQ